MKDIHLTKRGNSWTALNTFTNVPLGTSARQSKTFGKKMGITTEQQALVAAHKWIKETQADFDNNFDSKSRDYTFKEFYEKEWLKVNQHPTATTERYISALNNPVLKPIMKVKLVQINFKFLFQFFSNLATKKIRNRRTKKMQYPKFDYLNNYKKAISTVLKLAMQYQIISFNPTLQLDLKKMMTQEAKNESTVRSDRRDAYEIDELHIILEQIKKKDQQFYRMCFIMAATGMRPGELAALDLNTSIDFRENFLTINKALTFTKAEKVHAKTTKNETVRMIYFNESVRDILITQIIYINSRNKINNINQVEHFWLFSHGNNTPYKVDGLGKKWTKMLAGLNVHKYEFYSLRHTFASQMLKNGFDAAVISSHTGHKIETFFRYYVHPLESEQKRLGAFDMFNTK